MLTEKPDSGGPKRDSKKTSLLLSRLDLVLRLEKSRKLQNSQIFPLSSSRSIGANKK